MSTNTLEKSDTEALRASEGKYLTFELGNEVYGIEILKVQEIIGIMRVTSIPRTPDYVRGVINLRGKVIPVIDLRLKFGLPAKDDSERTCIIVVQFKFKTQSVIMGTIVDEVSEVLDIKQEQIEDAPSFGSTIDLEFIMGMGKVGDNVVMLLDADKVLSISELSSLSKISK